MSNLLNLLVYKVERFNPIDPLQLFDFIFAVSLVVSFLIYLRRFPVFRVVIGTLFLIAITTLTFVLNMTFTGLLLGFSTFMILVALPLIFAPEIRHYLEKLGRLPFLRLPVILESQRRAVMARHLVDTAFELAERGIGGTIVVERRTGLGQTIETGVRLDAKFGPKLVQSIFFPKSPLHDGAIIVKEDRIVAAGCLLPISGAVKLDPPFGTRHKSGLAMTKDTDAVVIIISEQRAEVSLAENGKLDPNLDRVNLLARLEKLI